MSLSSAKAKLDAQAGDPATGYISKQDHKDSYDELVADTALTGATTAAGITVSGAVQVGATAGLVVGASGPKVLSGSGSPEGAVTAPVGSIYLRTDGGADTAAYYKTSGTGNTGWTAADTGTGDVVGPASSTDNALVRFDGTGGKTVQNSGITVDDSGNVSSDLTISKSSAMLQVSANAGTSPSIRVTGDAGTNRNLSFYSGVNVRWHFRADNTTESGSNAGSNFRIAQQMDDGSSPSYYAFEINRASGKTTIGSVGASAGLELGSSGPRMMSGTGSPESVVTAPVGSIWFQTDSTVGVTHWRKGSGTGNTGWVVMEGDTGLRDVSALIRAAHLALNPNAKAHLRRVGNHCSFIYYNGASATATGVQTLTDSGAIPTGFQFTKYAAAIAPTGNCINGASGALGPSLYFAAAAQIVSATHSSGASYNGQISWTTNDAWPTSLPGSAA